MTITTIATAAINILTVVAIQILIQHHIMIQDIMTDGIKHKQIGIVDNTEYILMGIMCVLMVIQNHIVMGFMMDIRNYGINGSIIKNTDLTW
jgi:hypothetical protein